MNFFLKTMSLCLGAAMCASPASAWRSGAPGSHTGSPQSFLQTCRNCHGNNIGSGAAQFLDLPEKYSPNQVYDIRVRVHDSAKLGAGFEASVENESGHVGTIIISEPDFTGFAQGLDPEYYVTHTFDGVDRAVQNWAAMGAAAEYAFQWRAPGEDVGVITFYAAGNAINNNFSNSGDTIYLTNASVTFGGGAPCPADLDGDGAVGSADLAQLLGAWGPNPGNPGDLDEDGVVSSADLALMLGAWGSCP